MNINVGPFEGSHRITAVRHPWLISDGGLPENFFFVVLNPLKPEAGQRRILDNMVESHTYADPRYA